MDIFIEKLIAKKKTAEDLLISAGIVLAALIAMVAVQFIPIIGSIWLVAYAGIAYGTYYLISARSIEYEYSVINGDLDIDTIIAKRKRNRLFSANCKDFEIIERLDSDKLNDHNFASINRISAISSLESPDIYYAMLVYKGQRTAVLFEPDERMLKAFKQYIPQKVKI